MKTLLIFPSARKACAALVAALAVIENALAVPVWLLLSWRSRLVDALELENLNGGRGDE